MEGSTVGGWVDGGGLVAGAWDFLPWRIVDFDRDFEYWALTLENEASSGTVLDVDFVLIRILLHENQLLLFCFGIELVSLIVEGLFGKWDLKQQRKIEVFDFEYWVVFVFLLILAMAKKKTKKKNNSASYRNERWTW